MNTMEGTVTKETLSTFFFVFLTYYENSIKAMYALTQLGMTANITELMPLVEQK